MARRPGKQCPNCLAMYQTARIAYHICPEANNPMVLASNVQAAGGSAEQITEVAAGRIPANIGVGAVQEAIRAAAAAFNVVIPAAEQNEEA